MKKQIRTLFGIFAVLATVFAAGTGCYSQSGDSSGSGGGDGGGQGGSMARFTIAGDYLYTVDNSTLKVVKITDPANPLEIAPVNIGRDIETIFTKDDFLFIGSREAMYIYDISNPEFPKKLSQTTHFRSCDPVVAYENLAFVTLNNTTGWWCGSGTEGLHVYDITDPKSPQEFLPATSISSPRGLSVDGERKLVFVCAVNGVEAWDFTDPANLVGKARTTGVAQVEKIDAYDCIVMEGENPDGPGRLLIVGADGLYQLSYNLTGDNKLQFSFLSKIAI